MKSLIGSYSDVWRKLQTPTNRQRQNSQQHMGVTKHGVTFRARTSCRTQQAPIFLYSLPDVHTRDLGQQDPLQHFGDSSYTSRPLPLILARNPFVTTLHNHYG